MSDSRLSDNDIFLNKLFGKHVASSIVSMFGVMASVMANSIIAGQYFGAGGLAVMSVAAPFYFLFSTIGSLTCVGGSVLTSYALGRDDTKTANQAFTLAVVLGAGISVVVGLLCLAFLEPLLYLLGCSDAIYENAYTYCEVIVLGGVGTAMMYIPYNFFKLTGKLKLLTTLFLAMAAANISLDLLFISTFNLGLRGIAIATVLSSTAAGLFGVKALLRDSFAFDFVPDKKKVLRLLKLGTPPALNNLLVTLRLMIINRIIVAEAGSVGLAAFSVFSSLENFSLVVLSGLAQATSAFVGVFSKELDTVSVRRIEKRAHILGMASILVLMVLILLFPADICMFFGIYDSEKLVIASKAAYIFAFSLPPSVCCFLMFFYYQAAGFTNLANILIFCRSFLFLVAPAYFLTPIYGLNAVWWSLTIASISPIVIMTIAMPYYFKKGYSGVFLQDLRAEREGTFISFAVKTSTEAIIDSVEKIADFCRDNNLTKREIMLVRLSMEEMMMSIKEHCFDEGADETIDVRILIMRRLDDLMIVLRIRNGGRLFNPIDYYERLDEDDPMAMGDALGIAMISKAADSVHYKTTFGINNLTVIIDRKEGIENRE